MSDIKLEQRMLAYQSTGNGPTWLPDDHLGIKFKFEKDRTIGRQNLIDMAKEVVSYLHFLTAGLPVEDTAAWSQPGIIPKGRNTGVPHSDPSFGQQPCTADTYVDCYNKKQAAILYFLSGGVAGATIEQIVDAKIASGRILESQKVERARALNPTPADFNTNAQFGPLIKGPLPIASCLCWPLGGKVPLRLEQLSKDDINGYSPFPKDSASFPRGQIWSKFDFPLHPETANYSGGWVALKYKMISQFPFDCFGYDSIDSVFYANDLFSEYCEYLKDPSMSFDKFEYTIPDEIPRGPGGGLIPLECLDPNSSCPEWKKLGYASMDDWINREVIPNQAKNLSADDVRVVNTVNMTEEFSAIFNSHYLDYDANPEFMPTYEQVPQWIFSNACQDQLKFMKFTFLNTSVYMTRESYNYLISILVISRGNGFRDDLFKLRIPAGTYLGQAGEEAMFKAEPTWENTVACVVGTFRRAWSVPGDPQYDPNDRNATKKKRERTQYRFAKVRELVQYWYLLPESYFKDNGEKVTPTDAELATYFAKIGDIYSLAALSIERYDVAKNTSDDSLQNCLGSKQVFEGVGMTKQQLDAYKLGIANIFGFDWDGYAIEKYKTEMTAFNDRVRDLDWIFNHPIEAWFRDTFAPIGIDIMDFVCKAAPLVLVVISLTMSPLAGAVASAAFAAIEGTWTTLAPPGSAYHDDNHPTGWDAVEIISEHVALQIGSDIAGQIGARMFEAILSVALRGAAALSVKVGAAFKALPEELASASKIIAKGERYLMEDTKYLAAVAALEQSTKDFAAFNKAAVRDMEQLTEKWAARGQQPGELDALFKDMESAVEDIATTRAAYRANQAELVAYLEEAEKAGHGLPGILPRLKSLETDFAELKSTYAAARDTVNSLPIGSQEWGDAFQRTLDLSNDLQKASMALETESRYAYAMAYLAQSITSFLDKFNASNILLLGVKVFVGQIEANSIGKVVHNWFRDGIISIYGMEEAAQSWMDLIQYLTNHHVQEATMAQPVPKAGEDYPTLDTNIALPKLQILVTRLRLDYLTPYINAYARHMIMLQVRDDENKRHDDQNAKNNNSFEGSIAAGDAEFATHNANMAAINAALAVTESQLWDTLYAYFEQVNKIFNDYPDDSKIIEQLTLISNNLPVRPPPDTKPEPEPEPKPEPAPPATSGTEKCDGNYIEINPSKPSVDYGEPMTFNINLHYAPLYQSNPSVYWTLDDKEGIRIGETHNGAALNIAFENTFKTSPVKPGKHRVWANAITDNYDETCNSLWAWTEIEIKAPPATAPVELIDRQPTSNYKKISIVIKPQYETARVGTPFTFKAVLDAPDIDAVSPAGTRKWILNKQFNWYLDGNEYKLNADPTIVTDNIPVGKHTMRVEYNLDGYVPGKGPIIKDEFPFEITE